MSEPTPFGSKKFTFSSQEADKMIIESHLKKAGVQPEKTPCGVFLPQGMTLSEHIKNGCSICVRFSVPR